MKYLTQISIKKSVKKILINASNIGILNTSKTLIINDKITLQGIYNFIIDNEFFYCTNEETANLLIIKNGIFYKEIIGEFYLASLNQMSKDTFLIANGYEKDGFHLKYEICDKKTFEFSVFWGFTIYINEYSILDRGNKIEAIDRHKVIIWQTDISQYGIKRIDHHGRILDPSTPNTIDGTLIGYEDTVVVPLKGGQLLGLNISDGSYKWLLEEGANRLLAQSGKYLYSVYGGFWSEIEIQTGKTIRTLDLNSFLERIDNHFFYSAITNGKMVLDFNNNYSCLAVIDLERFELETFIENEYGSMMLRVSFGDVIWHDNKLYARDPISHALYVFEEAAL